MYYSDRVPTEARNRGPETTDGRIAVGQEISHTARKEVKRQLPPGGTNLTRKTRGLFRDAIRATYK